MYHNIRSSNGRFTKRKDNGDEFMELALEMRNFLLEEGISSWASDHMSGRLAILIQRKLEAQANFKGEKVLKLVTPVKEKEEYVVVLEQHIHESMEKAKDDSHSLHLQGYKSFICKISKKYKVISEVRVEEVI